MEGMTDQAYQIKVMWGASNPLLIHPQLHVRFSFIPGGVSVNGDDIVCKGFQCTAAHTFKQGTQKN